MQVELDGIDANRAGIASILVIERGRRSGQAAARHSS